MIVAKRAPKRSLLLVLVLMAAATQVADAVAFEGASPRTEHLRSEVRALRTRIERAPRASAYDVKRLERRLHERRIDTPRDSRLQDLELELRRLRFKADRLGRRAALGGERRGASRAAAATKAMPRYLGGAHTPPSGPPLRPDVGALIVGLQQDLLDVQDRLAGGAIEDARALLQAAETELAALRSRLSPAVSEDPNLIALRRQIETLREQLGKSD